MIRFVYVIGSADNPVKVGLADKPAVRLAQMQVGNPDELRIHHEIAFDWQVAEDVEKSVHRALAKFHRRGEWFNVSAAQAREAIMRAGQVLTAANENRPRREPETIEEIVMDDKVNPWAAEAITYYRTKLGETGGQAEVEQMNAAIMASAGIPGLTAFQTVITSWGSLKLILRGDPVAYQRARASILKAVNALCIWYAAKREQQLLDEILGNAA